mmetsp:Transcript_9999/g.10752  ORF Transcript_9999/g.10752 Transcript_9999/m.10752 type:complete len:148 (+) Transcript_9999:153-596(+)
MWIALFLARHHPSSANEIPPLPFFDLFLMFAHYIAEWEEVVVVVVIIVDVDVWAWGVGCVLTVVVNFDDGKVVLGLLWMWRVMMSSLFLSLAILIVGQFLLFLLVRLVPRSCRYSCSCLDCSRSRSRLSRRPVRDPPPGPERSCTAT